MAYIEIENLNYRYPVEKHNALTDVNLSLNKGEVLLLVGKSGSGKSTLGKALVGSVPNFYGGTIKGTVKLDGKDVNNMEHSDRAKNITMVFQDPEKQMMMNKVHREVAFGLENVGEDEKVIARRTFEALQFLGLLDMANRDIVTLSGGEKQKVAIASALSYNPKCIVLDEPVSQLDPNSAWEIVNLVRKMNEELGTTFVIIEQRTNMWFDLADKIAFMDQGKIKVFDSKRQFYDQCDEEQEAFMPEYLKLFKKLNVKNMPESFKEARRNLCEFKFHRELERTKFGEVVMKASKLYSGYDGVTALDDLNFEVYSGDFVGMLGANGAGKSTLMKSLAGIKEYEGNIEVFSEEVKKQGPMGIARNVGYVSQNPNDYISKRTVCEELKFTLNNHGIEDEKVIDETLEALDILDMKNKNPKDLSGGERQRVAIASILVLKPRILLLDEPTRGLDSRLKDSLGQLLKKLNEQGMTVIMVTHDMSFASKFCNRMMLMFNGRIMADGAVEQVLKGGVYYTTAINKLIGSDSNVFTVEQAVGSVMA